MILKALYDYYHRQQAADGSMPRPGFKRVEIPFLLVLDAEGNLSKIEDRRNNKKEAETFLVVKGSRSSKVNAYLMYDNLTYVAGYADEGREDYAAVRHKAFKEQCHRLAQTYPDCKVFAAVDRFYQDDRPLKDKMQNDKMQKDKMQNDELWEEIIAHKEANFSFLLDGETEIAASKEELDNEVGAAGANEKICLVTGQRAPTVKTTTATMIPGSQAVAKLVSFQVSSGYDSYGKRQCENAPISFEAESAYSSALLRLLGRNSRNKFMIGNRTYLFWTAGNSETGQKAEESLLSIFGYSDPDDPNAGIEKARSVFKAIYSGKLPSGSDDRFYMLGLAPNSARLAVVHWSESSLSEFSRAIVRHFDDMEIHDSRKEPNMLYAGLRSMLSTVTLGGKQSDVQPNLPDAVISSIVGGNPYPYTLFASAIRRIRAEQGESMRLGRVAIIKAYINRTSTNNKLTTMLDKTNTNPGYVCGRLFALIEYAQKRANNISTVRERYMNSASATPAAVFATLLNLSVHHVEKLDEGAKVFIEKQKEEIVGLLSADGFPAHLDLQDQGRFFVGYYQQLQSLYAPRENKEEAEQKLDNEL